MSGPDPLSSFTSFSITGGAPRPLAPRPATDVATIAGLVGAVVLIGGAIILGGSITAFVNWPSLLIVFGGTLSAVTVCFSFHDIANTARVLRATVLRHTPDAGETAQHMLSIADTARRQGVLSLQPLLDGLRANRFLHTAICLVVDGIPEADIEDVLDQQRQATLHRHARCAAVLRKAAEFAPAMGLIGTLIGLVQMLGSLGSPSTIGPAMAVALLTTFYGAVLANLVLSPLAVKLERNAGEEALLGSLYLLTAVSISRQENPRRLEMMLNSVLPPAKRVRFYD